MHYEHALPFTDPTPIATKLARHVRVSAIHVRALVEALEARGVSAELAFQRCGLDHGRLRHPYGWFELGELDQLLSAAVVLADDPAFGLWWGDRGTLLQYEILPIMQAHAPTLRIALDCILQTQTMYAERTEAHFSEHGGTARITCDALAVSPLGRRVRAEFVLAGLYRLFVCEGYERNVRAVCFEHARPEHGEAYDRIFGARVRFEQPFTGIELWQADLDRERPDRNFELHAELRSQLDRLRARLRDDFTQAERVKQRVRGALPRIPTMDEVARSLETSVRSLRRRLAEEATSYTALVDLVQRERTDELLSVGDRSIKQIASAVGFDSTSGFHRAYRRWTNGETPAATYLQQANRARGEANEVEVDAQPEAPSE